MPYAPHVRAALRKVIRAFNLLAVSLDLPLLKHNAGEPDVKKLRRQLLLKLHQDKTNAAAGAPTTAAWNTFQNAWDTYKEECKGPTQANGNDAAGNAAGNPAPGAPSFRMNGKAFLFTWNGDFEAIGPAALLAAIVGLMGRLIEFFGMKRWSATAERSTRSSDKGRLHGHGFAEWDERIDWETTDAVRILGSRPNVATTWEPKKVTPKKKARGPAFRSSADAGHFYVFMEKVGSCGSQTNYSPFVDYTIVPARLDGWWSQGKLDDTMYEYYAAMCGVGFRNRKFDIDMRRASLANKAMEEESARISESLAAMRGKPREYAVVEAWKAQYTQKKPRYDFLVIRGASKVGKTTFCRSIFSNPCITRVGGATEPNLRRFVRGVHDCIVLDQIHESAFIRYAQRDENVAILIL